MLQNIFGRRFWKRFLKRFSPCSGEEQRIITNSEWVDWASRLPRSAFIIWLAGHVADEIISNRSRGVDYQQLIDSVADRSSSMIQNDAEHFIEYYYFGYPPYGDNPQTNKLIRVFRRVIQRKIMHHAKRYP